MDCQLRAVVVRAVDPVVALEVEPDGVPRRHGRPCGRTGRTRGTGRARSGPRCPCCWAPTSRRRRWWCRPRRCSWPRACGRGPAGRAGPCGWRRRRSPRPTAAGAGGPRARAPARTTSPPSALRHSACGSVPAQTTSRVVRVGRDLPDARERGPGVVGEADRRAVGALLPGGAQVVGVHHRRPPVLGPDPREQPDPAVPRHEAQAGHLAHQELRALHRPVPPVLAARQPQPLACPHRHHSASPWLESGPRPPTTATTSAGSSVARTASAPVDHVAQRLARRRAR